MRLTSSDYDHDFSAFYFRGIPGLNPRTLQGEVVTIDGNLYTVTGVDTYAIYDATGLPFGLRVHSKLN